MGTDENWRKSSKVLHTVRGGIERLKEEHSILEGRLREIEEKLTRIEMGLPPKPRRAELARVGGKHKALDIVDPLERVLSIQKCRMNWKKSSTRHWGVSLMNLTSWTSCCNYLVGIIP